MRGEQPTETPVERRVSYCRICEQLCGIVADVADGQVVRIRGDILHPVSEGYICSKGAAMGHVQADPDRVRNPMRRTTTGDFVEVDWESALDDIARRLTALCRASGPDSIAVYMGNPAAFSLSHMFWAKGFVDAIGSKQFFSAMSQDNASRSVASHFLFGSPMLFPIPDILRTDFLLIFGANPMVSHGSIITAPPIGDRLRAITARGGRVIVVDPAATKTAASFEHQPIRPTTDAWLLAAMINVLFEVGLVDRTAVARQANGLDEFESAISHFTVETAAAVTGIDAASIRRLAIDFGTSDTAVAYGRVGICRYPGATPTNFLLDALNVVSGNFDRAGGSLFGDAPVDLAGLAAKFGNGGYASTKSRIGGIPDVAGHMPWVLADEIDTPGPGQPRALIMTAGNPVLSAPDGNALSRAIRRLDLVVSIDLYMNDSARQADYILPAPTFLERSDTPITFSAHMPIPWLQATKRVLDPPPGVREEWWIFEQIARRMGLGAASGQPVLRKLGRLGIQLSPRFMMDALLRTSAVGDRFGLKRSGWSIKKLEKHPHGIALPRRDQAGRASTHILHADGRVDLGAPEILDELKRFTPPQADGLVLIGRRQLSSINSWMHNVGPNRTPALHVNPADAAAMHVATGDEVNMSTESGSIQVKVEVTDKISPGVVSYPHGWGHDGGWRAANEIGGANVNTLMTAAPAAKDALSGASHLDGVPISIEPVRP
ncbi:Nitrate reductase [Mycolicibacterium rhodesiae JS60]|nr:Nitrate reductase [Mycolicibacterium rhodesiae JS60]